MLLQKGNTRYRGRQKGCTGNDSSIRVSIRPAFRLLIIASLFFLTAFFVVQKAAADQVTRIERLLSWTERVGVDLEGTKEVSTTLDGCELTKVTEYYFADPEPIGVKRQILTIDLRRVDRIEQSTFRGLYLVELYAHGFGSILRPLEDMKARTFSERWDGATFESIQNLTLNLFIPTPGRKTVGNDLQDYVEAYCSKSI